MNKIITLKLEIKEKNENEVNVTLITPKTVPKATDNEKIVAKKVKESLDKWFNEKIGKDM